MSDRGGGELVLAVAWLDACTGQHAFHEGKGERARGEGTGGATSEYGLTVFVDGPSARYNPPKRMVVRQRGSSVETLIARIKWLLVFV